MRIIQVVLFLFCVAVLIASCGSLQISEQNQAILSETNTKLDVDFFPQYSSNTEEGCDDMQDALCFNPDYEPILGEVVVFSIDWAGLSEFLLEPSLETLSCRSGSIDKLIKSEASTGVIEIERISDPTLNWATAGSGTIRIGSWPVYTEFIDFMSDPDNLVKILHERNIDDEILSCVIIEYNKTGCVPANTESQTQPSSTPTMCIWIHTNAGDYFLENYFNLSGDPNDTNFVNHYVFFTLHDYVNSQR